MTFAPVELQIVSNFSFLHGASHAVTFGLAIRGELQREACVGHGCAKVFRIDVVRVDR